MEMTARLRQEEFDSAVGYYMAITARLTEDEKRSVFAANRKFVNYISAAKTKANESVSEQLQLLIPDITLRRIDVYKILSRGEKTECEYSLAVPAETIELPDELLRIFRAAESRAQNAWRSL